MKHGKKPTKAQKIILKERHLNPDNWLIVKNTPEEMVVVHRYTSATRSIRLKRKEESE